MVDRVHGVFEEPKIVGEEDGVVVELVSNESCGNMLGDGRRELGDRNWGKVGDQGKSDVL